MTRTNYCPCGNDTYKIKWTFDGQKWAECSECGRPSGVFGNGLEKQREWLMGKR